MKIPLCLAAAAALLFQLTASAQVVINEFQYDDLGTDDREFVELYNAGAAAVDISGWVVGGYDLTTNNPQFTIAAGTIIQPGGFYVLANANVLNMNQEIGPNSLENEQEVITLRDGAGAVIDAVAYETNKGIGFVTAGGLPASPPADRPGVAAQVGPGIFGNHQGIDLPVSPLNASVSHGRFVDGRDTNNNGRDFGVRPSTPGTTNAPGGTMTFFPLADPAPDAPGAELASMAGSFAPVRVIDPAVADGSNPNIITPPYAAGSKAYVAWDPSGGGNTNTSLAVFPGRTAGFTIRAFLDTTDLPVQTNNAGAQYRGSEITLFALGSGDALNNLTDLDGSVGLSPVTLPASESANGFTGVAWIYERVAADPVTLAVSEKLHLVDANDGGDSDLGGNTPLDWTILATYNLSSTPSGWFNLSISMDAAGNGTATFNGQSTTFTAPAMHSSAFSIGYRENLALGAADPTPDALMRPATFTFVQALSQLRFAAPTPGALNFTIPVADGQTIGIEYSATLQAGSWLDLGNVSVAGGTGTFSDTDAGRLAASRGFYRAFLR